jgi:hypothetical protein
MQQLTRFIGIKHFPFAPESSAMPAPEKQQCHWQQQSPF